jgi:DNA-binding beta-propeller fold protein YncE
VDGAIAAGEGAVWVLNAEYGGSIAVTPVDPRTRKVGESIRVGAYGDARALTTGGGSVWVSDPAANAIRRIDARTRSSPRRRSGSTAARPTWRWATARCSPSTARGRRCCGSIRSPARRSASRCRWRPGKTAG